MTPIRRRNLRGPNRHSKGDHRPGHEPEFCRGNPAGLLVRSHRRIPKYGIQIRHQPEFFDIRSCGNAHPGRCRGTQCNAVRADGQYYLLLQGIRTGVQRDHQRAGVSLRGNGVVLPDTRRCHGQRDNRSDLKREFYRGYLAGFILGCYRYGVGPRLLLGNDVIGNSIANYVHPDSEPGLWLFLRFVLRFLVIAQRTDHRLLQGLCG